MITTSVIDDVFGVNSEDAAQRPWELFNGLTHIHIKYLNDSPETVAGLLRFDEGAAEAPHTHMAGQHHAFVLEGAVLVDGHPFKQGSYIHVPAGVTHALRADPVSGATLFFVYVKA